MKAIKAHGNCAKTGCGRYSEAIGADEEDARIMLNHEHGHEFKHCFDGDPKFEEVDTTTPTRRKR